MAEDETAMGTLMSFGYQKSVWKDRLRINPNITTGTFSSFAMLDVRDQHYKLTSLSINGYLDIPPRKPVSIVVGTGVFLNYSRGVLGTGGRNENNRSSEYFHKLYYGIFVGAGLRISPTNSRFAYELVPINYQAGNNSFELHFFKFGIDIKLEKR